MGEGILPNKGVKYSLVFAHNELWLERRQGFDTIHETLLETYSRRLSVKPQKDAIMVTRALLAIGIEVYGYQGWTDEEIQFIKGQATA